MKLQRLHILILLITTNLIIEEQLMGQICDDWKSQSTAYVVTGSTPSDPSFYQWEEKSNAMHGVHLCVLNADVIPVYIQQNNNYINFTTRFGPSTALLYILKVEVNINDNGYASIYQGSARQDVVWYNSSGAFPNLGEYDLKVRITFFDGTIRYRQYKVKVIPTSQALYKDNAGNTLRKWAGNDPDGNNAIVFSEGFDAYNTNGQEMYYHAAASLVQCFNDNGYDVYLLDNYFGTQDIRNNAAVFSSAVSFISSQHENELIVAGGVSMGGIISRYALAKAEQEGFPLPVHTFIAIDSPHQGAVVSETLQNFKKDNEQDDEFAKYALSNIAARQLLNYNAYDPSGAIHDAFYQELNSINGNGYPHLCRNIGVSFSTSDPNPNTGEWYKITYHTGPLNGTIKSFELTTAEKQAGSWLPQDLTSMSPIIKQASYWWLQLLIPGITLLYYPTIEFERFTDPAYILYNSALDIRDGESQFDVCIEPENTTWHDILPEDILEDIINEVILTDIYYQNEDLYTYQKLSGNTVVAGNQVTALFPQGEVIVHPQGELDIIASDRIMLHDGFSIRQGAKASISVNPYIYYECNTKMGTLLPATTIHSSNEKIETKTISDIYSATKLSVSIYPNPVSDMLHIKTGNNISGKIEVEIFNYQGISSLSAIVHTNGEAIIDVSSLQKGCYIARISHGFMTNSATFIKM